MLFKLGEVVATPGALRALEENTVSTWELLMRHANGDWGDIPEEDKLENKLSLDNGYRIMSVKAPSPPTCSTESASGKLAPSITLRWGSNGEGIRKLG